MDIIKLHDVRSWIVRPAFNLIASAVSGSESGSLVDNGNRWIYAIGSLKPMKSKYLMCALCIVIHGSAPRSEYGKM